MMKNYKVKALRNFTDSLEKIHRKQNDVFECDKERYEFLKSKGAVELVEVIEEEKEEVVEETYEEEVEEELEEQQEDEVVEEIISKKKKSSKK